jgi:hypothetical protein
LPYSVTGTPVYSSSSGGLCQYTRGDPLPARPIPRQHSTADHTTLGVQCMGTTDPQPQLGPVVVSPTRPHTVRVAVHPPTLTLDWRLWEFFNAIRVCKEFDCQCV